MSREQAAQQHRVLRGKFETMHDCDFQFWQRFCAVFALFFVFVFSLASQTAGATSSRESGLFVDPSCRAASSQGADAANSSADQFLNNGQGLSQNLLPDYSQILSSFGLAATAINVVK